MITNFKVEHEVKKYKKLPYKVATITWDVQSAPEIESVGGIPWKKIPKVVLIKALQEFNAGPPDVYYQTKPSLVVEAKLVLKSNRSVKFSAKVVALCGLLPKRANADKRKVIRIPLKERASR